MTDVRNVYITAEVAQKLDLTPAYLIRLAKTLELSKETFRETNKGTYLFTDEAIEIIRSNLKRK